jgi:beta-glucosidase-like glycosyl hydrolase
MQGDDPKYFRVIAAPKHYAVHSGPEPSGHMIDVKVSKHDEEDTYLPAFRAAIVQGKAASIMCAYNRVNGEPACANKFLLQDQLRGAWKFKGYVVSDCDAIADIFNGHHYEPTPSQLFVNNARRLSSVLSSRALHIQTALGKNRHPDDLRFALRRRRENETVRLAMAIPPPPYR